MKMKLNSLQVNFFCLSTFFCPKGFPPFQGLFLDDIFNGEFSPVATQSAAISPEQKKGF